MQTTQETWKRSLEPPKPKGRSSIYMTAHAARRLDERFGMSRLKQTPFDIHTLYCEASDIDRPVWAFRIRGPKSDGYMLRLYWRSF